MGSSSFRNREKVEVCGIDNVDLIGSSKKERNAEGMPALADQFCMKLFRPS